MEIDGFVPLIQDQNILQHFDNITASKAKCKTCKRTFKHTFLDKFTEHLKNDVTHENLKYDCIMDFENRIIQKEPMWKYIKLLPDSEFRERYECVLCKGKIVNIDTEALDHTHEDDAYSSRKKSYEYWQWKYCLERRNQIMIECGICSTNTNKELVQIEFKKETMNEHINLCNKLRQETQEQRKGIRNLWLKYTKHSYKKANCKRCTKTTYYACMWEFISHLITHHQHIITSEPKHLFNKSCKNLQKLHPDDLLYRCTICHQKVSEDVLLNHECKEDNNTVDVFEGLAVKYSVRMGDYLLKCAICPATISIWEYTAFIGDHECFENKDRVNLDILWKYFKKTSYIRAQCNICDMESEDKDSDDEEFEAKESFKYLYIENTEFYRHVETQHSEIFKFEKAKLKLWKYIKYYAGIYACVLCSEAISIDEFDNHMHEIDSTWEEEENFEDWPWKYCAIFTENDYENLHENYVRCDICRKTIEIEYNTSEMKIHLKQKHLKTLHRDVQIINEIINEIDATAGTSSLTQQQKESIDTIASPSSLTIQQQNVDMSETPAKRQKIEQTHSATKQRDEGLEDAGGPLFLTTTQQQDTVLKNTAGASPSSGTSGSPSKVQKKG